MPTANDGQEILLGSDTAVEFLQEQGFVSDNTPIEIQSLGGGVSNKVLMAKWDEDCLVLKQPFSNLDVDEDWPADVTRVHNEAAAARAYRDILRTADHQMRIPEVKLENKDRNIIAIECAPTPAKMWKSELLSGYVDADIATSVGQALGLVHVHAAENSDLQTEFNSKRPFKQLRVDPYHRTVAERHPDVADIIESEINRILSIDRTLVHGDYSPKNVLVNRANNQSEPWILDFEVAHWGDPAFDTAFMLNHLFIKSVYNQRKFGEYIGAVRSFWKGYCSACNWDIEQQTVTELGILMLARIDGKSPVEYIEDDSVADTLRIIAKTILKARLTTITEVIGKTTEEVSS